jgi:hypothetical protein
VFIAPPPGIIIHALGLDYPAKQLHTKEPVSLLNMKAIFSKLPESSLVRRLVLSAPDTLPREVAKEKAFRYLEMLEKEQKTFTPLLRR